MQRFLEENPGEFLFVSIKEDDSPKNSGLDFTEKLEQTLLESALVSAARTLPKTVGEARGRIHIISRYEDSTIGYDSYDGWKDSTSFALGELYVQDKYRVDSAEEKLLEIEKAIEVGARREYALLLNFTSCYYPDGFPPTYAGTPARKINERLSDMLKEGEAKGVFLCDFITEELCKSIIRRNFE
jgi:1-phosphatidylinositol phosphodiesterase